MDEIMKTTKLVFKKTVNGKDIRKEIRVNDQSREYMLKMMDEDGWFLIKDGADDVVMELKLLRTRLKMSRKELSEACFGIPIRTIQDWESGLRKPPKYIIPLIITRLEELGKL